MSLTLFSLCTPDLLTENAAIDVVVNLQLYQFICFHAVWGLVGSNHRCDSLGTHVRHHLCHCWMLYLLLSTMRKMRWKLTARPPCKHGRYMCCFIHTPSLLCWPALVSVLLMFQLIITVNKFYYHNCLIVVLVILFSVGTVFAFI